MYSAMTFGSHFNKKKKAAFSDCLYDKHNNLPGMSNRDGVRVNQLLFMLSREEAQTDWRADGGEDRLATKWAEPRVYWFENCVGVERDNEAMNEPEKENNGAQYGCRFEVGEDIDESGKRKKTQIKT